jgi:hypothetical protein
LEDAGVRGRILQQKYDGSRSWTELAKDRPLVNCYEHGNELPVSIKCREYEYTYTSLFAGSYFAGWPPKSANIAFELNPSLDKSIKIVLQFGQVFEIYHMMFNGLKEVGWGGGSRSH